jgi:outer membrane protein OmpA-like peptidoglycan-associated protein
MVRGTFALSLSLAVGCGGAPPPARLALDRVVLFQNGIGYFERHGEVEGSAVRMQFAPHEIDDVLKTVTVIDADSAAVANVEVAEPDQRAKEVPVTLRLSSAGTHRLHVSYAVPTPTWKATYRLVLDDAAGAKAGGLLQGWATINNTSGEDWAGVRLALATGAPFSYAMELHSPVYVSRPDVNGVMVSPVTTAVEAEVAADGTGDADGDSVKNSDDLCPTVAEDRDRYEDADGCPDPDNDQDRIPDAKDQCPAEPETYNGYDDEDGCPDRGRVVVTETNIEILDNIYFKRGSAALEPAALPILDAIAQTMLGNPDVALVEVAGHTSEDEARSWELSAERAAAIVMALRQRGVDARRLTVQGYGATQLLDRGGTEAARAKNRRGTFLILRRGAEAPAPPATGAITAANVARSARADSTPVEVAGASRYELGAPVTIPRGGATMVSILNQPVDAEDIFLFRPDEAARGSDVHPFRAVRLHNSTEFTLQPGALAVFARRTYVGDSLLDRKSVV